MLYKLLHLQVFYYPTWCDNGNLYPDVAPGILLTAPQYCHLVLVAINCECLLFPSRNKYE